MGARVGHYEIFDEILTSGPSTFYRAKNLLLGNSVIVRRLTLEAGRAADARETFFREMRHVAALAHPKTVRILDVVEADGFLWAVQEPRLGAPSSRLVDEGGPVALVDAARWGSEIADALAHMHARGYVSGRVTPRFVLVDEQGASLVAFTKSADLAAGIWPLRPAVAAHGPHTPPEELAGARPTVEGDVYSLAATVYHWLAGFDPLRAKDAEEALAKARAGAVPSPIRSLRPDLPEAVAVALHGALEVDPAARRGSAASLGSALDETYRRLMAEVPAGFAAGATLAPEGAERSVRIERRHGSGAFGVVFRARSATGSATLAVKALKAEHREDANARERFVREARALKEIEHENVVRMVGVGEQAGTPYAVMEFVDGPDLGTLVAREGALPPGRAARIAAGIARGLAAIHRGGIVHRDVKPHNVLVAPGDRPVIADFGIARSSAAGAARLTLTGAVVGTPAYMAPEVIAGEPPSSSADLFALGVILYEMLSGKSPFPARDAVAAMRAIYEQEAPTLPESIPAPLRALTRRLLEKDPSRRPPDAQGVADELEAIACGCSGEGAAVYPECAVSRADGTKA